MADITLAEFNDRVWLVGGEEHIDDLLANTLAPHLSIEIVACASESALRALWIAKSGDPGSAGMPWLIHPDIANRIRGIAPVLAVAFAPWSALLDAAAEGVIDAAARRAADVAAARVEIVSYLDPAGPPRIVTLARLRADLVEDALAARGIARERMARLIRDVGEVPGLEQESRRIDIVVAPA